MHAWSLKIPTTSTTLHLLCEKPNTDGPSKLKYDVNSLVRQILIDLTVTVKKQIDMISQGVTVNPQPLMDRPNAPDLNRFDHSTSVSVSPASLVTCSRPVRSPWSLGLALDQFDLLDHSLLASPTSSVTRPRSRLVQPSRSLAFDQSDLLGHLVSLSASSTSTASIFRP